MDTFTFLGLYLCVFIGLTSCMCLWNYDSMSTTSVNILQMNGEYLQISSETHNGNPVYTQQNSVSCNETLPFKLYSIQTSSDDNNFWTIAKDFSLVSPYCQCQSATLSDCMVGGSATWNCKTNINPVTNNINMGILDSCPRLTACKSLSVRKKDSADTTSTCADGIYYQISTRKNTYFKERKAVEVDFCDDTYMMFYEKAFIWMELPEDIWEQNPDPNACDVDNIFPLSAQTTPGWFDLMNDQATEIVFTVPPSTVTFTFNCSSIVSNSPVLAPTNHPIKPITVPPTKNPIKEVTVPPTMPTIAPTDWVPGTPSHSPAISVGTDPTTSPATTGENDESTGYHINSNIYGISLLIIVVLSIIFM